MKIRVQSVDGVWFVTVVDYMIIRCADFAEARQVAWENLAIIESCAAEVMA